MHQFGLVVVADREFSVVGRVAGSASLCTRTTGTRATAAVDKRARINILVFFRSIELQGGSNMTGTDLYVKKPHYAAAVRP